MPQKDSLPRWTDHVGHDKLEPLTGVGRRPEELVRRWLEQARRGRPAQEVRVLDVGCGRGETVAWLCQLGYDGHGFDVSKKYVDSGAGYFAAAGLGERLRVSDGGLFPFPDASFDVVLSNQVFEHVADMPALAGELARVMRPGASSLHVFPARWRPIEGHMKMPLVHWFPKGPVRRAAITASLKLGLAADHFTELGVPDRAQIFTAFSEDETFYRPLRAIAHEMNGHGLVCDYRSLAVAKWAPRLPPLPGLAQVAGVAYRHGKAVYMEIRRVG